MPKDFINLRLTGEIAMDTGDASCSFLMNPRTRRWSDDDDRICWIDRAKLPPIREPLEILGAVTKRRRAKQDLWRARRCWSAAQTIRLRCLGSGVCRPGLASDVTGTSCILTLIADAPLLDPEICNVATIEGHWGPFVLLETGGDAMRWARRAFHEKSLGYDEMTTRARRRRLPDPTPCSSCLISPARGSARIATRARSSSASARLTDWPTCIAPSSRASPSLRRDIFASWSMRQAVGSSGSSPPGGGAKTELWLKIKASVYGVPIVVPKEPECGVIGCAAMAATATGRFSKVEDAVDAYVRHVERGAARPRMGRVYARMRRCSTNSMSTRRRFTTTLTHFPAPPARRPAARRCRENEKWKRSSLRSGPICSLASGP